MHPHLIESGVTYAQHSRWALVAGFRLIWAGFASLLHAIWPGWFPATAAYTVIDLYHQRLENHPNSDYQAYIAKVKENDNAMVG